MSKRQATTGHTGHAMLLLLAGAAVAAAAEADLVPVLCPDLARAPAHCPARRRHVCQTTRRVPRRRALLYITKNYYQPTDQPTIQPTGMQSASARSDIQIEKSSIPAKAASPSRHANRGVLLLCDRVHGRRILLLAAAPSGS